MGNSMCHCPGTCGRHTAAMAYMDKGGRLPEELLCPPRPPVRTRRLRTSPQASCSSLPLALRWHRKQEERSSRRSTAALSPPTRSLAHPLQLARLLRTPAVASLDQQRNSQCSVPRAPALAYIDATTDTSIATGHACHHQRHWHQRDQHQLVAPTGQRSLTIHGPARDVDSRAKVTGVSRIFTQFVQNQVTRDGSYTGQAASRSE